MSVTITGGAEAQATLGRIADQISRMPATHQAIADLIRPGAAANVPNTTGRGTGALAASLTAHGDDTSAWLASDLVYAAIIEAGYHYTQAAIDASSAAIVALYEQGIDSVIVANGAG